MGLGRAGLEVPSAVSVSVASDETMGLALALSAHQGEQTCMQQGHPQQ